MAFQELPFHPLATHGSETLTFVTDYFDVGDYKDLEVQLQVYSGYAAQAGMLGVTIQHSLDLNNWYAAASFTAVTVPLAQTPTEEQLSLTEFLRYVRADIQVNNMGGQGLALFTFTVLGIARDQA